MFGETMGPEYQKALSKLENEMSLDEFTDNELKILIDPPT